MYSRFTALKNQSKKDQEKLENSTAAIVGLGATGSAIAENLARHGLKLIIIDRDYLEEKDSYSSSIYTPEQCKKSLPKAKAAENFLEQFTEVESHVESLSPESIQLLNSADIILDGTDNLETRQLINDYSKKEEVPWIYTAAIAEKAYSMPFLDNCFNCLVQERGKVATCETDGIMRETAQKVAASSSKKAVKLLIDRLENQVLEIVHEGRSLQVETSECPVCRGKQYPHLSSEGSPTKVCGENKFQLRKELDDRHISSAVETGEKMVENSFLTRITYRGCEMTFFHSGRIIVEAEDEGHAQALVSDVTGV